MMDHADDLIGWLRGQVCKDEVAAIRAARNKHRVINYADVVIYRLELSLERSRPGQLAKLTKAMQAAEVALEALKLEAAPYADRPGYREEWKP